MTKIHIIQITLLVRAIRSGRTAQERNAASKMRWLYINAFYQANLDCLKGAKNIARGIAV